MPWSYTGVYATEEEVEELRTLAETPADRPLLYLGGVDTGRQAEAALYQRCHELALAHGLPEIPGHYGIDGGEFIVWRSGVGEESELDALG